MDNQGQGSTLVPTGRVRRKVATPEADHGVLGGGLPVPQP